jgi:hypothetical protein
MKSRSWLFRTLGAVGLSMALAGAAAAQTADPQAPHHPQPYPGAPDVYERDRAPQRTLEREPMRDMQFRAQPGTLLEQARDAVQDRDPHARMLIRQAVQAIEMEARDAARHERRRLEDASTRLERIGEQLQRGERVDTRVANAAFAQAAHALAELSYAEARQALRAEDRRQLGQHLRDGARNLDRASRWTGREAERGVRTALGDAFELSGTITEGVGELPREAGRVIDDLGRAVEQVGRDIHGVEQRPMPHPQRQQQEQWQQPQPWPQPERPQPRW